MPVPSPTTSPITLLRQALKQIIDAEFAAEGFVTENDRLHPSVASNRSRVATFPTQSLPANNRFIRIPEATVQFYTKWNKEIDNEQKVDPILVETYSERFLRAVEAHSATHDGRLWYFTVDDITFPPDPTGNVTRFEARVTGYGNDTSQVETGG